MATGPEVELTIGYQQIEKHPLFQTKWSKKSMDFINKGMTSLIEKILGKMQTEIPPTIQKGATGDLRKSYKAEPVRGRGIELTGVWGTSKKYAAWHEWGTGPHFPPVAALIDWVDKKGLVFAPRFAQILFKAGRLRSNYEADVRSVAFIVARVISKRGTIPGNEREDWLKENEVPITKQIMDEADRLYTIVVGKRIAEWTLGN